MKNSLNRFVIVFCILTGIAACTVRSVTTTSTTPAAETTTYRTPYGTTSVMTPVAVTKTTETTTLH